MGISRTRQATQRGRWRKPLLIGVAAIAAVFAFAAVAVAISDSFYDLTTDPSGLDTATINGAVWQTFDPADATGSGTFHSFFRVQNSGWEQGYNTDYRPLQYDELTSATFTHAVPFNSVPLVEYPMGSGNWFREFQLDINELSSDPKWYMSLDKFQVWTTSDPNLTGYNDTTYTFPVGTGLGQALKAYDLDGDGDTWIKMDYRTNNGSGKRDYRVLVPESYFADKYLEWVVIYTKHGYAGIETNPNFVDTKWQTDDGFEEWGVRKPTFVPQAPTVTKTAVGTYDRSVTWELTKSVSPDSHTGVAGDAFSSDWTVVATKHETLSNFSVTGEITISNPNPVPLEFTVDDLLDDGTVATVDCPTWTVYPMSGNVPGVVVCTYEASPSGATATLNTATVDVEGPTILDPVPDPAPATATIVWSENVVGDDVVVIEDDMGIPSQQISATTTFTYSTPFVCSSNQADYTNGSDSDTYPNTATLTGDNTDLSDDAMVTVLCTLPPLEVSKTADAEYQRNITWELDKSVTPDSHSGFAGDGFTSIWTVVATKIVGDPFGHSIWGTISIHNPSAVAQTFGVADTLDDGTPVSVWCDDYIVAAGATDVCVYTAAPDDATATLNTVVVSAAGNPDQTATAPVSFTVIRNGDESVWVEDDRGIPGESISDSTTWTYPEDFLCSDNQADYRDGSDYDVYPNLATATGAITNLEADASVDVLCTLPPLRVSKTAEADYQVDIDWTLEKSVAPAFHTGFAGDGFSSTWTVVATKTESDPYDHRVWGTISINNPSAVAQTFSVLDILDDGTPVAVDCPSYTVAAGDTVVCTYTASPDDATATLNTAIVSAAGNPDVGATAVVAFTEVRNGDDEIDVDDDRGSFGPQTISETTTWTYDEPFVCSRDLGSYTNGYDSDTYVNVATGIGATTNLSDDAQVVVDCYVPTPPTPRKSADGTYVERHEWDVEKSVTPVSQTGTPGDLLGWTWTVTVLETVFEESFRVTGGIEVTNPHPTLPMILGLSDTLSDGTPVVIGDCTNGATYVGGTLTIPADTATVCSYSADLPYADDADAPTMNNAMLNLNGLEFPFSAAIEWTPTKIRENATLTDDQGPLNEFLAGNGQAGAYTYSFSYSDDHTCSSDRGDYGADGTYSATLNNVAIVTANDGTTAKAEASTTYICEAPFVDVLKTTNGVVDPTKDIRFRLYDGSGADLNDVVSTLGDADGQLQFQTALVPGETYTICEAPVPAGYTFEITVDGGNVLTYAGPPGELNPTGEIQCFDFVAPEAPAVVVFAINNRYPGGAPRTPGYWKNWSTCSGGNQQYTAAELGGPGAGVYLLDDLLPQSVGTLVIELCEDGVAILDARSLDTGKKMSSDAAYVLARALLAARLNQDAGACVPTDTWSYKGGNLTFEQILAAADSLLAQAGFDGTGSYFSAKDKGSAQSRNDALYLAGIIDDYNNGFICTGTPSH